MEAAKTPENSKEIPAFKKKRKWYYTSKYKCPNSKNFFRMPKINISDLSNEKQRT